MAGGLHQASDMGAARDEGSWVEGEGKALHDTVPPPPGEESVYDAPTRIGVLLQPDIANMFATTDGPAGAPVDRPHTVPPVSEVKTVRERIPSQSGMRPVVVAPPPLPRLYEVDNEAVSKPGETMLYVPSAPPGAQRVSPPPHRVAPAPLAKPKRKIDAFDLVIAISGAVVVLAGALVVYAYLAF
jgi:hypothetical protein